MAQKVVELEGVGPVKITRKRGLRSLRLRVDGHGVVCLSIPWWVSSRAGLSFVRERSEWIARQRQQIHSVEPMTKAEAAAAKELLLTRLKMLADTHGFIYASGRTKRLRARWGSCSQSKEIVLNLYLVQLPPELIDHVILHELTHTQHLNHGRSFWQHFESVNPDARKTSKLLKHYRPSLQSTPSIVA